MTAKKHLNNIWLKASVLGCLWASSEIVIGSFLHNLRIPFCGNILTGIGIIIMVSVGQTWTERGLFWRTGLVCALMKSISPSAIIFGPMLAIFSEALLMELSTYAFRKNIISFLVGGALAMSWNLAQLLIGFVITYGGNIIKLYEKLTELFQSQLGIVSNNYWWPIEIILSFYVLAGLISAAIGIYIGRFAGKKYSEPSTITNEEQIAVKRPSIESAGTFSLWLLFLNITFIVIALAIFNFHKLFLSGALVIFFMTFWIFKYPKVLRPLKKPRFWIFLVLTTTLSAYLFTSLSTGKSNGWIIGVEMNLRAIVMILGFAVVGRELRNPVVGKWMHRVGFKQLPYSLELAFESLPAVISNMPKWKDITRKPIASFGSYMQKANYLLELQEKKQMNLRRIIIITGEIGEGKTSLMKKIITAVKAEGLKIKGFLALAAFDNLPTLPTLPTGQAGGQAGKRKTGYNLLNVADNTEVNFIRTNEFSGMIKFRKYYFSNEGLDWGNKILLSYKEDISDILIIDEIGPWELEGGGWAESLKKLAELPQYKMIWVVRKEILDDVINKWNLENPVIIDISQTTVDSAKEIILKTFSE